MYLGEERIYAASSCKEIATRKRNATSGYYYLTGLYASPQDVYIVYCDLEQEFVENTRGWMRIGLLNMSNPDQICPRGFEYHFNSRRLCRPSRMEGGCTSIKFEAKGIMWRQVCGKIIVHYERSVDGLSSRYECPNPCTLNDPYVDGVSITHGSRSNAKHIWTVSAHITPVYKPNYIGDNYGEGPSGSPVHFCTELMEAPNVQQSDINVNVCRDQGREDEDVTVELIELYVR